MSFATAWATPNTVDAYDIRGVASQGASPALDASVRELTAAIAAGDTAAFARLYRERFDEMYTCARNATCRDEAFCLDVVQDAMLRVIRSLGPLDSEQHLRGWLRAVVQSCAYDRLRKEARRKRWERNAAAQRDVAAETDDPADRLDWLRRELAGLDHEHLRLLIMRYRLGWTLRRIGEALGLKPGAVDGRLGRLLTALRKKAREAYDD